MLNFGLATPDEICLELGRRLRAARIAKEFSQGELGKRAGVATRTITRLEAEGHASMLVCVRVALALDLADQLEALFTMEVRSIVQMERAEQHRQRAPRRKSP
jgi:DNA-binding XRE family transcriptional regulator